MTQHHPLSIATALAALLALGGCWGNNDDDPVVVTPAITEVPDSASVSGAALVSFILGLDPNDETSEPLTIKESFSVPDDETSEPTPLT